jgi:hypothetical protein
VRQQSGRAGYRVVVLQLLGGVVQLLGGVEQFVDLELFVVLVQQFVDAGLLELVIVQLLVGRFKFFVAVVLVQRLADGSERRRLRSGRLSRMNAQPPRRSVPFTLPRINQLRNRLVRRATPKRQFGRASGHEPPELEHDGCAAPQFLPTKAQSLQQLRRWDLVVTT